MFRKSRSESQINLFSSPQSILGERANKTYSDPKRWHNVFYDLVTSQIDEEIFSVLFKEGNMGAPTASIRILISMSILKEGFGCSDEQLFEKIEFDILVRRAVGIVNLDEVPPSLNTYYLFNRRLCEYQKKTQIDLMEKCFESPKDSLRNSTSPASLSVWIASLGSIPQNLPKSGRGER